jgi:voltage-gated potassium channel
MVTFAIVLFRFFRGIWLGLKDPEFEGLLFTVMILLVTGTIFYMQVEKWDWLDSLFFSVTTLTTVGYGQPYPHTVAGKVFTIIYIFIGLGAILGFVNILAHHTLSSAGVKKEEKDTQPEPIAPKEESKEITS